MAGPKSQSAVNSPSLWYKELDRNQKRVLIGCAIGWGLDSFDYSIYSFSIYALIKEWGITTVEAGLVITGTLFASALGGVIFGILSDKYGRVKILSWSIILYAVTTGFILFSQNIWQVLIIRIIAGLGLGGEWTAGATLVSETWPEQHRGKGIAIMQMGYSVGTLLAALISGPVIALWGWRMLYLIGVLPAFVAIYVRRACQEPGVWLESKNKLKGEMQKGSIFTDIFKKGLIGKVILGFTFVSLLMVAAYPSNSFTAAYIAAPIEKGGLDQPAALSSLLYVPTLLGAMFGYMIFGFLSDKIGRKKCFLIFIGASFLFGPTQILVARYSIGWYIPTSLIYGFFATGLYAGLGAFLSEQFPTKIRATATGFCYNGGKIMAALSVMVAGMMIPMYGYFMVLFVSLLIYLGALICTLFIKDRTGVKFEA